jgi:hypothetical protein
LADADRRDLTRPHGEVLIPSTDLWATLWAIEGLWDDAIANAIGFNIKVEKSLPDMILADLGPRPGVVPFQRLDGKAKEVPPSHCSDRKRW